MKSMLNLLLQAASIILLVAAGPPNNNAPFPSTLSQCGDEYSSGEVNSTNYYRCTDWNDGIGYDDSDKFLTYDAYFNGTLNMVYIPLGSTQPRRPYLAPVNASLSIGQMVLSSDSSVSRSKWDANDFFMSFTTFEPASCVGDVTCSPSFYTVSDSSYYYWSQVWTLSDTKNGDGFDISGSVTKTKAVDGNGFYFAFPADDTYTSIESINNEDLFWDDYVTMTGHVSPSAASITFTVSNFSLGSNTPFANLQYTFTGTAWSAGAKLNTSNIHPTTTGQSKAVVPPPATTSGSSGSSSSGVSTTVIGAAAGGGILFLLIVIGLAFCFCCGTASNASRRMRQQRRLDKEFQRQQQQSQQQNTPVVVYAPGQYPMQHVQPTKPQVHVNHQ